MAPAIVWFRQDLRLADNPALDAAVASGRPVLPVYILDDVTPGMWAMGGASRWWLHHSLASLGSALRDAGAGLLLRRGEAAELLPALVAESGAGAVYWNRCYEPYAVRRDTALKDRLQADGIEVHTGNAALLFEPWTVLSAAGEPLRVFGAFQRRCLQQPEPPAPAPAPVRIDGAGLPPGDALEDWDLLPTKPDWAGGLRETWQPGEAEAGDRLAHLADEVLHGYAAERDRPDRESISRLSPYLHFGEIGPRQVWAAVAGADDARREGAAKFRSELIWREFSYQLLYHFPTLPEEPFQPRFAGFGWSPDRAALRAWQRGRTGYPIVDAGMRQLWHTGWMHNRVRLVVASFLTKHLLIPWQEGEAWFWDTLVDADLASNAANWQWVAGSGADAAPYFRIFNPILQGKKFDPDGAYVRQWVPELAGMPAAHVHAPWEASPEVLKAAGVTIGGTYPAPHIEHGAARDRALAAYRALG